MNFSMHEIVWVDMWVEQATKTKKPRLFKTLVSMFGAQKRTRTSTVLPAST